MPKPCPYPYPIAQLLVITISNTQSFAFNPIRGRTLTMGAENFSNICLAIDLDIDI
jgi:hypothetical protein